jgi:hypothetical protein
MPSEAGWPELGAYYDWLATNRIFLPHALEVDRSLDYAGLAKSFVAQYCARSRKPIHGATCHKNFDRLLRIWPRARFVHLLRDGRDVARSCVGMGWAGNVWHGAQRWIEAEALWSKLSSTVDEQRRFELRYEDLVRDPEGQLTRLCAFLGTDYESSMLEYSQDSSYERPDPDLIGQWRKKLGRNELALLETRIGSLLRQRGYEDSGVPAVAVGAWRRLALTAEDRLERFRFRLDRYGLSHIVQSRLARLPGGGSWRRRLLLARNKIDNRHLK